MSILGLSGPTSIGKTLAQALMASAWTSPSPASGGLLKPARVTENSIELVAQGSSGTGLALDELALIDGKTLGQMVYGLAGGQGKARMTAALKLHRQITWRTFVLTSCEQTLEGKITSEKSSKWTGGMAARFPDIDCSGVNAAVMPSTIAAVKGVFENYGHAGPEFIRRFIARGLHRDPAALRDSVTRTAVELANDAVRGSQTRSAEPFAQILVAGELAQELWILPQSLNIAAAVKWAWGEYAESAGAEALKPEDKAEANLRRWVAERFPVAIKNLRDRHAPEWRNNRDTAAWYDANDNAVYLPSDRIVEAAGSVVNERAVARMLRDRNLLARTRKRRLYVEYVPTIGYLKAYALRFDQFAQAPGEPANDAEDA